MAIGRALTVAAAWLAEAADRQNAVAFPGAVIEAVPYHLHTVLADSGIQVCHPLR